MRGAIAATALAAVLVAGAARAAPPDGCSLDGRLDRRIWRQAVEEGDRRLQREACRPGEIGWPWNLPGSGPRG